MNIKDFKNYFSSFADGIPVEGPNSAQWKRLKEVVNSLEEEVVEPKVPTTRTKK